MRREDLSTSTRYYVCKQSIESEGYGQDAPREPYPVKLEIAQRPGGEVILAHSCGRDGSDVDDDANATALVRPDEIFETLEQAKSHYRREIIDYVQRLGRLADEHLATIGVSPDLGVNSIRDQAYGTARAHGWWSAEPGCAPNIPEKLMLIVSEVSEALEDYREGRMAPTVAPDGKPIGFPSEMADVLIRIGDLCGHLGIDVAAIVRQKLAFNETRPHRHGGKAC